MFKIYSKGCEHALRALTQIPAEAWDRAFLAKDICRKAKVPESSTRKILQGLVRAGLLNGVPGPGGGYVLSKHPKQISLLTIIKNIDGKDNFNHCVMGFTECNPKHPCPIHYDWKKMKEGLLAQLSERTLNDLMVTKGDYV